MSEMIWYGKAPSGADVEVKLTVDGKTPAETVASLKALDVAAKTAGFARSERFDRPSYGGGGRPGAPRPETPPPADLEVPEHCGVAMVYKPPKEAADGKKAVAARWECRKGRDCAEPEERGGNKYPATNWHMTKKAGSATEPTPAEDAKPVNWAPFWRECTDLGVAKEEVWRIAGVVSQVELLAKVKTKEKLDELLARVKRARPAA